jgi:hypothetical protein
MAAFDLIEGLVRRDYDRICEAIVSRNRIPCDREVTPVFLPGT